jgi:membrane associated rhomboid family serine protease
MRHHSRFAFPKKLPLVTAALFIACLVVFALELCLGRRLPEILVRFAVVPVGLASYFHGVPGATFSASVLPFFTSLLLHGGYIHLLLNLSYLWVVGDFVEDWLGRTRFLVLILFGAAAELIVRMGLSPIQSGLPSVGVSGSVAALIGAFLVVLAKLRQRDPAVLAASFLPHLPVTLALLAWFPAQFLNRCLAITQTTQTHDPVSWPALAASLLLGMFLLSLTGRRIASTPAVAPAFPKEETAPALGA